MNSRKEALAHLIYAIDLIQEIRRMCAIGFFEITEPDVKFIKFHLNWLQNHKFLEGDWNGLYNLLDQLADAIKTKDGEQVETLGFKISTKLVEDVFDKVSESVLNLKKRKCGEFDEPRRQT